MSSINPKWKRYVTASVNKYFTDGLTRLLSITSKQIYCNGQDLDLTQPYWLEIRTKGPRFEEYTKNSWFIDFAINVSVMVPKSSNVYLIQDVVGATSSLFTDFGLFNYDNPAPTTINQLCCLVLQPPGLEVYDWGDLTIGKDPVRVSNMCVQGSYRGDLDGSN